MTRDKALKVSHLLFKIESLETLHDDILDLDSLGDIDDDDLKEELLNVVTAKLDKALKELEEM